MKRPIVLFAAAALLVVGNPTATYCDHIPVPSGTASVSDVTANPGGDDATAAAGAFSGVNDTPLLGYLNHGLFPEVPSGWVLAGKSDDADNGPFTSNPEAVTGTLTFDEPINGPFVISLKSALEYAAYFFDDSFIGVTSVDFSTIALSNPGGQTPDLSHASLFIQGNDGGDDGGDNGGDDGGGDDGGGGGGDDNGNGNGGVVPEPGTMLIWSVIGIGGLLGAGRYRRRQQQTPEQPAA